LDDAGYPMNLQPISIERVPVRPASSELSLTAEAALELAAADFAARAGALADLLQRWRRPALARTVLASLLAGDGDTFRELLRDFDPPLPDKCWWIREVVERIAAAVELRTVCRLRTDLTAGERRIYLQLVLQHRQDGAAWLLFATGDAPRATGPVIAPGPFLAALRAEGLVTCVDEPVERAGLQQVLARPELVCV
jgi:hypothetical protein